MGGFGSGSGADTELLAINDSAGADKIIAKEGELPGGSTPDLVIPHMVKRLIMREKTMNKTWQYAYKAGDITAGKGMPVDIAEPIQFVSVADVPPVIYVRGLSSAGDLIVEIGQ